MSLNNSPLSKGENSKSPKASRSLKDQRGINASPQKNVINFDQEFYTKSLSFFVSLYDTPSTTDLKTFTEIQEQLVSKKSPEEAISDLTDLSDFDFDSIIIENRLKNKHKQEIIKMKEINESFFNDINSFDQEVQESLISNPFSKSSINTESPIHNKNIEKDIQQETSPKKTISSPSKMKNTV